MDELDSVPAEMNAQLRLLDAVDGVLIAAALDGTIVGWNTGAELLTGVLRGEALGKLVFEYLDLSPHLRETLAEQLQAGGGWQGDCFLAVQPGKAAAEESLNWSLGQVPTKLSALPIVGRTGQAIGALLTLRSFSTQDLLANRMDQWFCWQRLATMGQLATYLSHEINQPLSAICNFTGGLMLSLTRNPLPQQETIAILERISAEAFRAGSVVNRLRSVSAPIVMEEVSADANAVVEETLLTLKNYLAAERTVIRSVGEAALPPVRTDSVRLEQVLINLIKNAVEAMRALPSPARLLEVATRLQAGQVEILISDCGPALTPESLDKFMQPFFTTKPQGLGMGLWISRALVAQHGGQLELRRIEPQGLQCLVRLPTLAAGVGSDLLGPEGAR